MAYMSLYRKWRPQTFADVVGQSQAVQTIKNALDHDRLSHAYLFCGPRGVGKTTVARLIAKGLNCVNGPTSSPCNHCSACERIAKGLSMDVIEIDAASNRGIDEIRDLRDKVRFAPTEGKYKVYIIDEVHMLTTDAFNALLKTLEEPPEHVVFILATTEPHKIPATILSRCQRYDFRSLTDEEIGERLAFVASQEGLSVTRQALAVIAKHAAGGMRDALGLLDQCAAFAEGEITEKTAADALGIVPQDQLCKFVSLLAKGEAGPCIELLQEVVFVGKDLRQFAKDTGEMFRMILLSKLGQTTLGREDGLSEELRTIREALSIERLVDILEYLGQLDNELRLAADERIPFELGIIRITSLAKRDAPDAGVGKSKELEALRREVQELRSLVIRLEDRLNNVNSGERQDRQPGSAAPAAAAGDSARGAQSPKGEPSLDLGVTAGQTGSSRGAGGTSIETESSLSTVERSAASSGEGIDRIREIWESIFDVLKQERQASLGAFLREAQPAAVTEGRLLLAFPPDRGFHKASVEQPKMKELLERVIARLVGKTYLVQCEFGTPQEVAARYGLSVTSTTRSTVGADGNVSGRDGVGAGPVSEPEQDKTEPDAVSATDDGADGSEQDLGENDPIVKAALDIFKGKLIKLK